jgi:cobalt/nickel transport system permease protein
MHLGNGAITPECAAMTTAAAGTGLTWASLALRRAGIDRGRLASAGALTGAIFAAQMVNVPVLPFSSAHLVGGVLAAWILGPPLGALSMAIVLTMQAILLGDGGVVALGANIINMGLLPAAIVALVQSRPQPVTAGLAAALSVVAAAVLIVVEVALTRGASQFSVLPGFALRMVAIHLWIAVPEGLLTVAILTALGGVRAPGKLQLDQLRIGACWGTAVMLLVCFLPFASPMPDGYEAAAELSGLPVLLADDQGVLAVSSVNAAVGAWQSAFVARIHAFLPTEEILGLAATLLAGLTAIGVARLASRARPHSRIC